MRISYLDKQILALAAGTPLFLSLLLGTVGSSLMDARAEDSGQPKTTGYPAVQDVPPRPEKPAMTADEQLKLKNELSATRDRQRQPVKPKALRSQTPVKP
jgi:hypothetical protein